ncbi:hypothetical protein AAC387_Pa03g1969 [Persea americana]
MAGDDEAGSQQRRPGRDGIAGGMQVSGTPILFLSPSSLSSFFSGYGIKRCGWAKLELGEVVGFLGLKGLAGVMLARI